MRRPGARALASFKNNAGQKEVCPAQIAWDETRLLTANVTLF
jgi:hypothetical protein